MNSKKTPLPHKKKSGNAPVSAAFQGEQAQYGLSSEVGMNSRSDERKEAKKIGTIQRQADQSLERKPLVQLQDLANDFKGSAPVQQKTNATGLPNQLKSGIENLSGIDISDVKVHYNSSKPAQLQAHAYAQGTDIHVASGQEKHLAHEAWHVVQQKQGRVQPTRQLRAKVQINDDVHLEKEADDMGAKAMQLGSKQTSPGEGAKQLKSASTGNCKPVQGVFIVNGTYVSRNVLLGKQAEIMRDTRQALALRGYNDIQPGQWQHVFQQLMILAQSPIEFRFNRTSEAIAQILGGQSADNIIQHHQQQEEQSQKADESSQGVRAIPRLDFSQFQHASSSTAFLNELRPDTDTSAWNGGHDQLKDAHHKIGKNVLAWLYDHMDAGSQRRVKLALHLDLNARALALTRLGSNLISPEVQGRGRVAKSDSRRDDPMNNSQQSQVGQEYLDLMHDTAGNMTPRSRVFSNLANNVVRGIYARYQQHVQSGSKEAFVLTSHEVDAVIIHLREAEMINFRLEGDIALPSHSSGDAWQDDTQQDPRPKFKKAAVKPVDIKEEDVKEHDMATEYDKAAHKKLAASLAKKKLQVSDKIMSFKEWFSLESEIHEDPYELDDMYDEYVINERSSDLSTHVDDLMAQVRLYNKHFPDVVRQAATELRAALHAQIAQLKRAWDSDAAERMYAHFKIELAKIADKYT